jgi:tetratricopeptide (TPR) repeat protein
VAGRLQEAGAEVTRLLEADPHHLPGLELYRRIARSGGDEAGWARATARLGAELLESERAAALLGEAARVFARLGLREEAAHAFRAVLDRTPLDGAAFKEAQALYGALYAEHRDPGPLVELLTHRLAHVEGEDRIALYLDRAEALAREHDRDGAEEDLRAVLDLSPDNLPALRRLAAILGHKHARAEATRLFQRCLDLEPDRGKRREVHLEMADLEEAAGRLEAAVVHLNAALEIEPRAAEQDRLAGLHIKLRHWQNAVGALRRLAELTPDGTERARVELRMATIYRDGFADPRASVESLMRALTSEPLELEALARMVTMSESGHVVAVELEDRIDRAVDKARAQVGESPGHPEPYQKLGRLWAWRGDEDARQLAAQAEALVRGQPPPVRQGAIEPARELPAASWERLMPTGARTVALEIWRAAWTGAAEIYGPALASLGVGKGDQLNKKGTPSAWIPVDKIARALGCVPYQLFGSSQAAQCSVVGDVLVCGASFADRLTPSTRFRVARALALLRERLGPLEILDDHELALFFAACAKVAETARPPALQLSGSEARLDERARALGKALGRKERNALKAIGPRFAELGDPAGWRQAVLDGAARAGLTVGGDLGAALGELRLDVMQDRRALELVMFGVSADMLSLRREMGLRG